MNTKRCLLPAFISLLAVAVAASALAAASAPPGRRAFPRTPGADANSKAGALRVNPALLGFMQQADPTFPKPILSFREGPIWDAQAIERWIPTRQPLDARDRSLPRS